MTLPARIPRTGDTTAAAADRDELVRASYRELTLYAPDRTPCATDLSDNTNLWGAPPAARRSLHQGGDPSLTRYPSLYGEKLKQALGAYLELPTGMLVTGCGSDDLLDSALRAFCEPGERVALPSPTFPMIPTFARMNALEPMLVPLHGGVALDADALLATRARVIYLCSPNNPTGGMLEHAALARVIREAPGIVILDEAYADFAGGDELALLRESDRLLVCRTMSKAFGLAGLRIGYMAGAPELVAEVEKSRGPYKVSAVAEHAAIAALTEDLPWVRARVADAVGSRERLAGELLARGLSPLPSRANFLLLPLPGAQRAARRMRELGVATRAFPALPGVGDALRITAAPWPAMMRFLEALDRTLHELSASVHPTPDLSC